MSVEVIAERWHEAADPLAELLQTMSSHQLREGSSGPACILKGNNPCCWASRSRLGLGIVWLWRLPSETISHGQPVGLSLRSGWPNVTRQLPDDLKAAVYEVDD